MIHMINKNILHYIKTEIESASPIIIYNTLISYYEGYKHHHIEEAINTYPTHIFFTHRCTQTQTSLRSSNTQVTDDALADTHNIIKKI